MHPDKSLGLDGLSLIFFQLHLAVLGDEVQCDVTCPLCAIWEESVFHLFTNCSFFHTCQNVINAEWSLAWVDSLHLWMDDMCTNLSVNEVEKVVMVCWAIWENRNDMVWNNQTRDPNTVVTHRIGKRRMVLWPDYLSGKLLGMPSGSLLPVI